MQVCLFFFLTLQEIIFKKEKKTKRSAKTRKKNSGDFFILPWTF